MVAIAASKLACQVGEEKHKRLILQEDYDCLLEESHEIQLKNADLSMKEQISRRNNKKVTVYGEMSGAEVNEKSFWAKVVKCPLKDSRCTLSKTLMVWSTISTDMIFGIV